MKLIEITHKIRFPFKKAFTKQAKIFLHTFRGFMENKVILRASALTYFTMLSVVPLVAMAFAISKGFGLERLLQQELTKKLAGQQEVVRWIFAFAKNLLERTKGGVVAGVGFAILLWAIIRVLGNIEESFNEIWKVKKGRTFFRKSSDYIAIILIAPIFMILSSSITVYITTQIAHILKSIQVLGFFSPYIRIVINLIPYMLIWFLFTFIFMVMPNTVVRFKSALSAGILAGTIFQIIQWGYVKFQLYVSNYNAVYGSFAALPLFMVWLQTGWLVVLLGAQMSYANQNYEKYEFENELSLISQRYKKTLSLLIANFIFKKFAKGENAPNLDEISSKLEMPTGIVREIINNLTEANIIIPVIRPDSREEYFVPATDINHFSVKSIIDKLDFVGIQSLEIAKVPEMDKIMAHYTAFDKLLYSSKDNILLKDI